VNRRRRAYRPGELPERIKEAGGHYRRPTPGCCGDGHGLGAQEHPRRAMVAFLLWGLLVMAKAQGSPQTLGPFLRW
jgi:hypothetical protein